MEISPKWTNKNPEKWRGLDRVTIVIFVTASNISPELVATDLKIGTRIQMIANISRMTLDIQNLKDM